MKSSYADLFERVASRTKRWTSYSWYWGDAIAVDGMLERPDVDRHEGRTWAAEQINRWATTAPDSFDDVLAPGLAIMKLQAEDLVDKVAVERFVAAVDRLPVLACGFPVLEPHRRAYRFGVCIDAIYHLPPALAMYGHLRSDKERTRAPVDMAINATRVLACPAGWAQWYDDALGRNNAISWSRGVGWALLGLLDLLQVNDGYRSNEVEALAIAMLERLAQTQNADGNWSGVLADDHAQSETSTAAFFVAGALHPCLRRIWTPPAAVLDRAADALIAAIDEDGVATGVSADILPSWDLTGYRAFDCEPSPWGQGAALRALAALDDSQRAA